MAFTLNTQDGNTFGNVAMKSGKVIQFHVPQKDVKLKKDGTPKTICQNKKKGKKSEVYTIDIEDMKKILNYYSENGQWLHYMLFVIGCNMVRRIGDTLSLTWKNFYNPSTGNFRENILEIEEQKSDKIANPRINSACRAAIELYIEKTGCDPSKDGYTLPVFMQLSGTYKGRVLSESGYLKSLKKAAEAVGIEQNIGTHSTRKTFGELSRMIHPYDYDNMEILQTIYNHSSTKITKRYIGLTRQKVDSYYDDMGTFFNDYVTGDKVYKAVSEKPIISIEANDLTELIKIAYECGKNNASSKDAMVHVNAITELLSMVDDVSKSGRS